MGQNFVFKYCYIGFEKRFLHHLDTLIPVKVFNVLETFIFSLNSKLINIKQ